MSGIDRQEILRRDCLTCKGHGYVNPSGSNESACDTCGGSGQEEKTVDFKFDGERTPDELEEIWRN